MKLKRIFKTVLFFFFFLLAISVIASDVVEIKPTIEIKESTVDVSTVVYPRFPMEDQNKKRKGFFKRWKEKVAKKKLTKFLKSFQFTDTLKCDIIITDDGEEIEAKVLEVNTGAVVYQLCDQEGEQPRRTLLNSKILMIKYADGYKEVFKNNKVRNQDPSKTQRKRSNANAWGIGFLLGVVLGLLGILMAYVIYLDEPYHRRKAIAGSFIGMLAVFFFALFLITRL
ncbi:MAG: hypothetical protein AB8F74_07645 [Saprospiraceae bacterium]